MDIFEEGEAHCASDRPDWFTNSCFPRSFILAIVYVREEASSKKLVRGWNRLNERCGYDSKGSNLSINTFLKFDENRKYDSPTIEKFIARGRKNLKVITEFRGIGNFFLYPPKWSKNKRRGGMVNGENQRVNLPFLRATWASSLCVYT